MFPRADQQLAELNSSEQKKNIYSNNKPEFMLKYRMVTN
jgi:hypothetical protein